MKASGGDPLAQRHAERDEKRAAVRRSTTFQDCAEQYLQTHEVAWKNPKHRQQWRNTLVTYAFPKIGSLAIGVIDVPAVLSVIEPIWSSRPETASRIRGRIETVLDWARVKGMREGENPARWKGNLDHALPRKSKVRKVRHFSALMYSELPGFISELRKAEGAAARALEFLILTAARTSEVIGARWDEIDMQNAIWVVPEERMKAKHRESTAYPCQDRQ